MPWACYAFAMVIDLFVSILGAGLKTIEFRPLQVIIDCYIEIIRNTPFLVQLLFIYFGLPSVSGLKISADQAVLLALVVNFGAYGIEIIRAGIEAIKHGQIEAGLALGLSRLKIFRFIILKPALRTVYPALTSQFIYLMLNTSIVSAISANDLSAAAANLASQNFTSFETYFVITIVYLLLSIIFSLIFALINRMAFHYPTTR